MTFDKQFIKGLVGVGINRKLQCFYVALRQATEIGITSCLDLVSPDNLERKIAVAA